MKKLLTLAFMVIVFVSSCKKTDTPAQPEPQTITEAAKQINEQPASYPQVGQMSKMATSEVDAFLRKYEGNIIFMKETRLGLCGFVTTGMAVAVVQTQTGWNCPALYGGYQWSIPGTTMTTRAYTLAGIQHPRKFQVLGGGITSVQSLPSPEDLWAFSTTNPFDIPVPTGGTTTVQFGAGPVLSVMGCGTPYSFSFTFGNTLKMTGNSNEQEFRQIMKM